MLLVFIFFTIVSLIIFLFFSSIKIYITISDSGYKVTICVFILKKIRIYKHDLNLSAKGLKKNKSKAIVDKKNVINYIRKLNIRADHIYAKIYVGTSEVQSTAIVAGILNSIIGIFISCLNIKITKENCKYKVIPIYSSNIVFHLKIKCIFSTSLVHIISTFMKKKIGDVRNGR